MNKAKNLDLYIYKKQRIVDSKCSFVVQYEREKEK